MKIPDTINAGGIVYRVIQNNAAAAASKEANAWGITRHSEQVIYLDPDMKPDRQAETLLHELMHVAICQIGLAYMFDTKKELNEEEIVNGLSRALYSIIKSNNLDFRDAEETATAPEPK